MGILLGNLDSIDITVFNINQTWRPRRWWSAEDYIEASKPLIREVQTVRKAFLDSAQYQPNRFPVALQLLRPMMFGAGGGIGLDVVAFLKTPFWRLQEPSFWIWLLLVPFLFGILMVAMAPKSVAWKPLGLLTLVFKDGARLEALATRQTWETLASGARFWGCGVEEPVVGPPPIADAK